MGLSGAPAYLTYRRAKLASILDRRAYLSTCVKTRMRAGGARELRSLGRFVSPNTKRDCQMRARCGCSNNQSRPRCLSTTQALQSVIIHQLRLYVVRII